MGYWAVVVSAEEYAAQRLYARDGLPVNGHPLAPGDEALIIASGSASPGQVFALGRVRSAGFLTYTHRMLDEPVPAGGPVPGAPGAYPLDEADYAAVAARVDADRRVDADKRTWLVSVDLPIEASSPAEAVRTFWSYVEQLGPRELPTYVSPSDDELAMQAYVLGEVANLDPEEDDD